MKNFETIVFDLDGTITQDVSTWNTVHKWLGVEDQANRYLKRVERRAQEGKKVNAIDWAKNDIELWKGYHIKQIVAPLYPIKFFNNAVKSIRMLRDNFGYDLYIISGTFNTYMEAVLNEIDNDGNGMYIKDWMCHIIEKDNEGFVIGVEEDPNMENKSVGIKHLADIYGFDLDRTIAIGNGSNDIPMFNEVGMAIGFNGYSKRIREAVDININSHDFFDIVRYLIGWRYYG